MIKHDDFQFAKIPAGIFVMGSPEDEDGHHEDEKQHLVTITRPFEMMKWPVTTGLYNFIMNDKETASRFPKVDIDWHQACDFCRKLSELDPEHIYRLPTEAEWEYACRAGTTGPQYGNIEDIAWYSNNTKEFQDVGQKTPNSWGLYDMLGNVYEWCSDYYKEEYNSNKIRIIDLSIIHINPVGPSSGSNRVFRGGSFFYDARDVRAAYRNGGGRNTRLGFRPARLPLTNKEILNDNHARSCK